MPPLALYILGVTKLHDVVRLAFHLCCLFAGKDQVEFIAMMKVERNHVAGGHFIDVGNNLPVRNAGQVYLDQRCHLASGNADLGPLLRRKPRITCGHHRKSAIAPAMKKIHSRRLIGRSRASRIISRQFSGRKESCLFMSALGHKRTCAIYSITSSARSSNDRGKVIPIALAVLRLMTSSIWVGNSTGRSPGLAPFKILSA
jgi:hypothetical protein